MFNKRVISVCLAVSLLCTMSGCAMQGTAETGEVVSTGVGVHNVETGTVSETGPQLDINVVDGNTTESGVTEADNTEEGREANTEVDIETGTEDTIETTETIVEPNPKAGVKKLYKEKEKEKAIWGQQTLKSLVENEKGTNLLVSEDGLQNIANAVTEENSAKPKTGITYKVSMESGIEGFSSSTVGATIELSTNDDQYMVRNTVDASYQVCQYDYIMDKEDSTVVYINPNKQTYVNYMMSSEEVEEMTSETAYSTLYSCIEPCLVAFTKDTTEFVEDGITTEDDINYIYEQYEIKEEETTFNLMLYYDELGVFSHLILNSKDGMYGDDSMKLVMEIRLDTESTFDVDKVIEEYEGSTVYTIEEVETFLETTYEYDWDEFAKMMEETTNEAANEDKDEDKDNEDNEDTEDAFSSVFGKLLTEDALK